MTVIRVKTLWGVSPWKKMPYPTHFVYLLAALVALSFLIAKYDIAAKIKM
jgi:hypothetical protein